MMNLLTLSYWFDAYPSALIAWASITLLVVFLAMVILGIFTNVIVVKRAMDKWMRRAMYKVGAALMTMGFIGLLLVLCGYEQVPFLSMRFWYLLWLIGTGVWAWFLYKHLTVYVPKRRAEKQAREQHDKWIPRAR